ncbi:MAG: 50S ribosomal protein L23 [Patescibacteria group bacterium]|nr:50S ribosomal protein L23 [Patescibacteria group bacterium]
MSILDKIRKKPKDKEKEDKSKAVDKNEVKKQELKKKVDKKTEKKEDKKQDSKKKDKTVSKVKKVAKEKIPIHHFEIIRKPHISEKAFNLESEGKYVFVVSPSANKVEIKKAIQNLYGVVVKSVNIVKVPSKPKRFRGVPGTKSGYKKAVVTLAKGSKIDVMKEAK